MALLEVRNLRTYFHTRDGVVKAVDDVSFDVEAGQTVGIVGESGSGKSVTCYSLLNLIPQPPGCIESGTAKFGDTDLLSLSEAGMRKVRGSRIGLIFQDPMTSLNPYLKISTQLIEPLQIHQGASKSEALERAVAELDAVGIPDPHKRIHNYPHEFSGGMRQRVMIAMALITRPEILIADEPTTALDVTIQRQVLDLIKERQEDLGTAVIFITHDLAVVSEVCDYVNVMYAGRFVERADVKTIFNSPKHAYTRALQKSIPAMQLKGERLYTIPGLPPNLAEDIAGCAFAPRCEVKKGDPRCIDARPELVELEREHWVQNCPGCLSARI
ncbi:MAG: dipeptide/oligopeptide/nickel ABC transporter ATP-binding protein [Verrucomicrobiales bacterium]|jgi:oligopeptide transport system ATP-binding protein|nr:dipeptide/oligopeptide/nickel ABC transporter ATP-binding protein [Verrucomicrobiales bacterium]|tara:strand:+ start:252 stop:1235 length:984 start_codon:yes stop_codon:yes gene_type:complete